VPAPLPLLVYALGGVSAILLGLFVYLLLTGESVYLESHWGGLGGGLGGWRVSRALSALLGAIVFASICVLLAIVLQQSEIEQKKLSVPPKDANPAKSAQP
jgi:thiosulfate reductase cytochrome b subunit